MTKRESKPRVGMWVSVESMDDTHEGKIVALTSGEALIRWRNGEESLIDVLDLLKPDGSSFDSYRVSPSP